MRSVNENEGVILMYLNTLNVADMGILCCMPLLQSLIRLDLRNMFCLVCIEFFIPLFFSYPVFAFEGVDTAHVDGKIGEGYV